MAAPSPTARQSPNGKRLKTGFKSLITFARVPNIALWERGVTPPGLDGGDPVDTSTMHNIVWHTKAPRELIDMTPVSCRVAYDPKCYVDLLSLLNIEDTITVRFSDGSTLAFFGFLRNFEPDEMVEENMPEATVEIEVSNADSTGAEQDPVMTEVVGT